MRNLRQTRLVILFIIHSIAAWEIRIFFSDVAPEKSFSRKPSVQQLINIISSANTFLLLRLPTRSGTVLFVLSPAVFWVIFPLRKFFRSLVDPDQRKIWRIFFGEQLETKTYFVGQLSQHSDIRLIEKAGDIFQLSILALTANKYQTKQNSKNI